MWRLRQRRDARRIVRALESDRLVAICAKYRDANPDPGYSKFLDIEFWMRQNLALFEQLDLHPSPRMEILDLGCGAGYFLFLCNYFGHSSWGIDLDEVPMYNDLIDYLGIRRVTWRIESYKALPTFPTRFDMVSALMICFNNHDSKDLWGPAEWHSLLFDLKSNCLKPEGRIVFQLNRERDGDFGPGVIDYFKAIGARVNDNLIDIKSLHRIEDAPSEIAPSEYAPSEYALAAVSNRSQSPEAHH